ncbi:hypothetical protein ACFPOA_15175 [Lysobacter niabensis]|uniref:hypothetical protein n=1 Tax=Agrilutibacter niabensis TaxID=380628 RepID=UPI003607D53F
MRVLSRFPLGVSAWLLLALLAVAACAAPAPNGSAQSGSQAAPVGATTAASAQLPAGEAPAPKRPMRTGGPQPAERIDAVAIDATCKTDADCTVKNVGNCCGYYPACVNVDSPTDPKRVQAECAKKGLASVCGFPEISSCTCSQGHCEAASGGPQVR